MGAMTDTSEGDDGVTMDGVSVGDEPPKRGRMGWRWGVQRWDECGMKHETNAVLVASETLSRTCL